MRPPGGCCFPHLPDERTEALSLGPAKTHGLSGWRALVLALTSGAPPCQALWQLPLEGQCPFPATTGMTDRQEVRLWRRAPGWVWVARRRKGTHSPGSGSLTRASSILGTPTAAAPGNWKIHSHGPSQGSQETARVGLKSEGPDLGLQPCTLGKSCHIPEPQFPCTYDGAAHSARRGSMLREDSLSPP